ncbi:MAG: hypothetical protein WDA22_10725 [Bacteroidota bacterium]
MKGYIFLIGIVAIAFSVTGCYSQYGAQYARGEIPTDSSAMLIDDIIKLSNEGISDTVIVSQINATYSYFVLDTDDIVELKKAGVSEKVINEMINTSASVTSGSAARYYGNPFYLLPYYSYPWYSSFYLGFFGRHYNHSPSVSHFPTYNRGHYNRGYSGGHGIRGHSSGGSHRSSGKHR